MEHNNILVSVCMGLYNGENFIINTLKSIQNQTYKNFEVILVDDHSTDNTITVVTELFCKIDNRFKLFINSTDSSKPYVDSHNKSYEYASGKYLFRMDQDDIISNDYIESRVKFMEEHHEITATAVLEEGQLYSINGVPAVPSNIVPEPNDYMNRVNLFNEHNIYYFDCPEYKNSWFIWHNNTSCLRKDFYDLYKPKFEFESYGDVCFWRSVLAFGGKLYIIPKVQMIYSMHDNEFHTTDKFNLGINTPEYQVVGLTYTLQAYEHEETKEYLPNGCPTEDYKSMLRNTINYYKKQLNDGRTE